VAKGTRKIHFHHCLGDYKTVLTDSFWQYTVRKEFMQLTENVYAKLLCWVALCCRQQTHERCCVDSQFCCAAQKYIVWLHTASKSV